MNLRHIDFTKTTRGIPKKGQETAEDIKYWKAIIKARDEHARKISAPGYKRPIYDWDGPAINEELYAIPIWWLKENDR